MGAIDLPTDTGAPSTPLAPVALLAAVLLAALPAAAPAQLRGQPLAPVAMPGGVSVGAEIGLPDDDIGRGTTWDGMAAWRTARAGLIATVGSVDVERRSAAAALRAEVTLLRAREHPFEVVAFAGAGADEALGDAGVAWRIPVGASLAFRLPTPFLTLRAVLAPRVQFRAGADPGTDPALAGGLEATLWRHVRLRVATDVAFRDGPDEQVLGVGVTYTFTAGD